MEEFWRRGWIRRVGVVEIWTIFIDVTGVTSFISKTYKHVSYVWVKVLKNGPSKTCGRLPLKNLKGLPRQIISLQSF